ncbi:MAG: DEAD/DEAH box helicase [Planctomycetes bacterium]|nr:DEAD/DEAH box helicase [Planctomycetota bacterium]
MNAPTLRPYQRDAIAAVVAARKRGVRRQVISLPTGSGKTVIFSRLASLARHPVLVLAHRAELLEQARAKLEAAGVTPVEIEQGSRHASPSARAVVASIRSLGDARLARLLGRWQPRLVIYDECHHAPAEDNLRVLEGLGVFDEDWPGTLVGFTATTSRGDGVGLDRVFDEVVFEQPLPDLISDGYLVGLRGFRIATSSDLRSLASGDGASGDPRQRVSDFELEALAEAVDVTERNALVARSIQELARDRRTIVFCVNVAHAKSLAKALRETGVRAAPVHGQLDAEERKHRLADFSSGKLQAITNVAVLTEGFDDPGVSCVAMARPIRSSGLYAQCVGRGTRLAPGKKDCLVLDFVDLGGLSLITLPTLYGIPHQLDLEGRPISEVAAVWRQLEVDFPDFELGPDAITLEEIQQRAAAFDPVSLRVDPEVRAISPHAWASLGSSGLALHIWRGSRPRTYCVLATPGRGRRWRVTLEGKEKARFSTPEEAVEAVDYEVERLGPKVAQSALHEANWRQSSPPRALLEDLAERAPGRPPQPTWGGALVLSALLDAREARRERSRS